MSIFNLFNSRKSVYQKSGGYFGEMKQAVSRIGQTGKLHVHHMPCASSIEGVRQLDRGKGPAIIMSARDHKRTASYGNSRSAQAYQSRQAQLVQNRKIKQAFNMDVRDLKCKGLYGQYKPAVKQARQHLNRLIKDKEI